MLELEVERARHDARNDGGARGAAKVLGGKSSTGVPGGDFERTARLPVAVSEASATPMTSLARLTRVNYFRTTLTLPALPLAGRITMSISRPRRASMRSRRSVEKPRSLPVTTSEICDGASRMMYAASVCVSS